VVAVFGQVGLRLAQPIGDRQQCQLLILALLPGINRHQHALLFPLLRLVLLQQVLGPIQLWPLPLQLLAQQPQPIRRERPHQIAHQVVVLPVSVGQHCLGHLLHQRRLLSSLSSMRSSREGATSSRRQNSSTARAGAWLSIAVAIAWRWLSSSASTGARARRSSQRWERSRLASRLRTSWAISSGRHPGPPSSGH
jgi:hypothetical protein